MGNILMLGVWPVTCHSHWAKEYKLLYLLYTYYICIRRYVGSYQMFTTKG